MQTYKSRFRFGHYSLSSSIRLSLLLILWTFGIILGTVISGRSSAVSVSLMRQALSAPVSIVSLFVCVCFPFAFTAAAVLSGRAWLIYFLSGLKGFSFGFTGAVCLLCFGNAGWLIRCFLLFSQITTIPALWYVWLCFCPRGIRLTRCSICSVFAYISVVVLLDYFKVAPFLSDLSS